MGVWIETEEVNETQGAWCVTPHVGVWIETVMVLVSPAVLACHAPRGRVD